MHIYFFADYQIVNRRNYPGRSNLRRALDRSSVGFKGLLIPRFELPASKLMSGARDNMGLLQLLRRGDSSALCSSTW